MRTIITGGTLVDGTGRSPVSGMALEIDGGRIRSVGRAGDFGTLMESDEVCLVDATGKWILPGFINMHDHLLFREVAGTPHENRRKDVVDQTINSVRNAHVALRRGWTTIREMGNVKGITLRVRDLIASGAMLGPRILTCGSPVSITGGHARGLCVEADGPDACRKAVREQLKADADFVKVMASHDPYPMPGVEQTRPEMSVEEIRAVFEEGRRWGKKSACHVMGTQAITNVLDTGVDVVDHGAYLSDALAERMARQGTYLCPTLSAYCRQTMNPKNGRGEEWMKAHMVLVEPHYEAFRAAMRAGVKVVCGTDSTGIYAEEVELMRERGMSAMDSILACTRTPAEALGLADSIGTLEEGKLADVVLLAADPLADPYALAQVDLVIKEGAIYRPSEIAL